MIKQFLWMIHKWIISSWEIFQTKVNLQVIFETSIMYKTLLVSNFTSKLFCFKTCWFIVVLYHRAYFSCRIFKKSKYNQKVSLLNSQRYPLKELLNQKYMIFRSLQNRQVWCGTTILAKTNIRCFPNCNQKTPCLLKSILNKNRSHKQQNCLSEKRSRKWYYGQDCKLSLIHIWRCRRYSLCRSRWSPYH